MSLLTNPQFTNFRNKCGAAGLTLRRTWEATISKAHGTDVVCYAVLGGKQPQTIIVADFGEGNGFGLWFASDTNSMDEDVERLVSGGE